MAPATKRRRGFDCDAPRKKPKPTVSTTPRRVTRQITTDGPRKAVFATAELLENIFLFLPPKSIMVSQRTCRQFRDIVATSVKIQEHVFLRPAMRGTTLWLVKRSMSVRGAREVSVYDSTVTRSGFKGGPVIQPVRLHPLLQHTAFDFDGHMLHPTPSEAVQRVNFNVPVKFRAGSIASWVSMYLTQPPVTKAMITLPWKIGSGEYHFSAHGIMKRTISDEQGVTFGQIMDAALNRTCSDDDRYLAGMDGNGRKKAASIGKVKLVDLLNKLETQYGHQVRFSRYTWLALGDVMAPTEDEWARVG